MEALVRLAAQPIGYIGATVLLIGLIYLGISIGGMTHRGGDVPKALALIAAGGTITGFAVLYGFAI